MVTVLAPVRRDDKATDTVDDKNIEPLPCTLSLSLSHAAPSPLRSIHLSNICLYVYISVGGPTDYCSAGYQSISCYVILFFLDTNTATLSE